jgi:hypothetical protein
MNDSIGGFIGLELCGKGGKYHKKALALNTGRACFNLIIKSLKPVKLYLPFYSCDSLISPARENKINFDFYAVNDKLEIAENIDVKSGEYIVYINYFGVKSAYAKRLGKRYGKKLILDNTQAFFRKQESNFSFNSARKFFGVPDGAYLYGNINVENLPEANKDISLTHLVHRTTGNENAYAEYVSYENSLSNNIKSISKVSEGMLACIDYDMVKQRRIKNFKAYHKIFSKINLLDVSLSSEKEVPMCYPLVTAIEVQKECMHKERLFIPTYWNDVLNRNVQGFHFEKEFVKRLLPLPVDQRYRKQDVLRAAEIISRYI